MALPKVYSDGTASVANGSTAVTGTGTAWSGNIVAGDYFRAEGLAVRIASVESNSGLTLVAPWPGTTLSGSTYEISFTPDVVALTGATRELRLLLGDGGVPVLSTNNGSDFANPTAARQNVAATFTRRADAEAATIPAAFKCVSVTFRSPNYAIPATLAGGAYYTRTSKADIDALGIGSEAYFRSQDRFMPDGSIDATNGGYWLVARGQTLGLEAFGAVADDEGVDNTGAINTAVHVSQLLGIRLTAAAATYWHAGTLVIRQKSVLHGVIGWTRFKLADDANVTQCESFDFDTYEAADAFDLDLYPELPYGFDWEGIIFDGNMVNQTLPTVDPRWGVRIFGRRYRFSYMQICNTAGTGFWTKEGSRAGSFEEDDANNPNEIKQINITNTLHEHWVHDGPVHTVIESVTTNNSWAGQTGFGTSLMFPGEPIHGLRPTASFQATDLNLNGVRSGRTFYADGGRIIIDNLVTSGGCGQVYFGPDCWGRVDGLFPQANWEGPTEGVFNAHIENLSNKMELVNVTPRRQDTANTPEAPCILDSGGAVWKNVRNRQARAEAGDFFVADAVGVNVEMDVTGVEGAALRTTANADDVHATVKFNNVATAWANEKTDLKIQGSFIGRNLGVSDEFSTGVTDGSVGLPVLRKLDVQYEQQGVEYYSSATDSGSPDFSSSVTKSIIQNHGLWRAPAPSEVSVTVVAPTGLTSQVTNVTTDSEDVNIQVQLSATTASAVDINWSIN